jgi:hypothetical protein
MNQNELRLDISLSDNLVREVLPSYFTKDYPVLVSFLEAYYEYVQQEGEFGNVIDDLVNIRDLSSTELQYLDLILEEIGLGISQEFFTNPREVAKNFANFFRVKGTKYSYEGFFRAFYNSPAELSYPKEQMFTVGDPISIIGSESPKILQDSRIYQFLSVLLKTEESLAKWESLYKKFVHPAGIHLYHEMQIKDTNKQKFVGNLAELEEDNSLYIDEVAPFKYKLHNPQPGKSPIGNGEEAIALLYSTSTYEDHLPENVQYLELFDSSVNTDSSFVLNSWGMSYNTYLDLGYIDSTERLYDYEKDVHIAPIDLSYTLKHIRDEFGADLDVIQNSQTVTLIHGTDDNGQFTAFSVPNVYSGDFSKFEYVRFNNTLNVTDLITQIDTKRQSFYNELDSNLSSTDVTFIIRGNYSSYSSANIQHYIRISGKYALDQGYAKELKEIGGDNTQLYIPLPVDGTNLASATSYPLLTSSSILEEIGSKVRLSETERYQYNFLPELLDSYNNPTNLYDYFGTITSNPSGQTPVYGSAKTYEHTISLVDMFGLTKKQLIDDDFEIWVSRFYYKAKGDGSANSYVSTYINNSTMVDTYYIKNIDLTNSKAGIQDPNWVPQKINLDELVGDSFTIIVGHGPDTSMKWMYRYQTASSPVDDSYTLWIANFGFVFTVKKKIIWDWVKYDSVQYDPLNFDLGHNKSGRDIILSELNNETVLNIKDLLL